jgi:hypothetical protein
MAWTAIRIGAVLAAGLGFAILPNPADAARYHRYKRVGGHWIEGRFPSQHRVTRRARAQVEVKRAIEPKVVPEALMPPARPNPMTTGSTRITAPEHHASLTRERQAELQSALRRKAAERASEIAVYQDAPPPRSASAEPVSVSIDFKRGLKTTLFANGDLSEEAFDAALLRGLAAPPPAPLFR